MLFIIICISIDSEETYSEPDVSINHNDMNKIITASNKKGAQAQFYSSDGGFTWEETILPYVEGDIEHTDPIVVEWTSDGTAWAITVCTTRTDRGHYNQLRCYKSNNHGRTWTLDSTPSGDQTKVDKEMMWVDHSETSFKDNIYVIWLETDEVHLESRTFVNRCNGSSGVWPTAFARCH